MSSNIIIKKALFPLFLPLLISVVVISTGCEKSKTMPINKQSVEKGAEVHEAKSSVQKNLTITIVGMSCLACVAKTKKALLRLDGISRVEVSLKDRLAHVAYNETRSSPEVISKTINELGYKAGAWKIEEENPQSGNEP